ncbi:DAN domain family member 5 [Clupea harengus]|uniref:DAN domain family member 5 n=1 Tax=Clupea harengus TaxID=7950 RepID=A0A6P8EQS6_CLUHA|nr:DAN domain family member 5 [Clupea harengus]
MWVQISIILSMLCGSVQSFPRNAFESVKNGVSEFEASGAGADEPVRGSVRVVQVGPHFLRHHAGMLKSGLSPRRTPSLRGSFPDFLALGRAGPSSLSTKLSVPPVAHLRDSHHGFEAKKRQGASMWQRVMDKNEREKETVALPINPREISKQSCAAIPFTHRVTAVGCETVTVHNNLCFGQCSSMFVPPSEDASLPATGHRGTPCSRCAPSKARVVTVPLRCGLEVRQKRVMVVEECQCETGREQLRAESAARTHL